MLPFTSHFGHLRYPGSLLDRDTILRALRRLSERLERRGVVGEVSLLGGTAMVLGFQARQSTKDVDAIFAPVTIVREEARGVAGDLDLPGDWLNDAAKGFVSPQAEFRDLPDVSFTHLRVQAPVPEYLLAMKVMAARASLGGVQGDKEDIRFLIRHLHLSSVEQAIESAIDVSCGRDPVRRRQRVIANRRPQSLAEVAEWSTTWDEVSYNLADFLHEFAARPEPQMLRDRPRLLAGLFERGEVCDAYLAATAAMLAPRVQAPRPEWTEAPERYLRTPWFASPGPSMRACLLLESPARFRERNLFVTANALSVA